MSSCQQMSPGLITSVYKNGEAVKHRQIAKETYIEGSDSAVDQSYTYNVSV